MLNLDLTNVKESGNSIVPEGNYNLICEEAEVKDSKSGGQLIKCKFSITSGEYKNFKVYHNFNIYSQNPKAVEIGLAQLKSFLKLAGLPTDKLTDVNIMIGRECSALVKIRKSDEYPDQNVISYFKLKTKSLDKEPKPESEKFPF